MNSAALPLALLSLGGGLLGGYCAMLFMQPAEPLARGSLALAQVSSVDAAWQERIEQLELENQSLQASLSALQGLPRDGVASRQREELAAWVDLSTFEAFQGEVLESLRALETRPEAAQVFQEQVADAVTALRKEEMAARYKTDAEKRIAGVDQSVERMATWLGLTVGQSDQVREVLIAREQRNQEMIELWRSGVEDAAVGERKRADAEQYDAEMLRILSPQQFETFRAGRKAPK